MAKVYTSKADLALDEWISRLDHGTDASRAALDEVFRLFVEERNPLRVRRLSPAMLVHRLAVYRLRRTRSIGAEWRYPPGPPRPIAGPLQGALFGDADGVPVAPNDQKGGA